MAPKRVIILSNPRSGSTLLANYLKSHPDIYIAPDIYIYLYLNDEEEIPTELSSIEYLEKQLQVLAEDHPKKSVIGFKVFPEQIYKRRLTFDQLILSLGISHVIVLWRNDLLETFVSKLIAESTGNWYSLEEPTQVVRVQVDPDEFEDYKKTIWHQWEQIGQQWPIQIPPIYIEYETFINNKNSQCNFILEQISCQQIGHKLKAYCKRQNPAPLSEKTINWAEVKKLVEECPEEFILNVQSILEPLLEAQLRIPRQLLHLVPDREPPAPVNGWKYRVAEPFISPAVKQKVYEAIESGFVSSAGCWVSNLSSSLKSLYRVPVAQPCSNGFTAISLALQTIGIGSEDEIIIPSLTMIAVGNAVSYYNGKVIFADSNASNYNPSWSEIETVATNKTKAVIVTHSYGVPTPEIQLIAQKCKERGWWLIEDISECVGIRVQDDEEEEGRLLGTFGDFACASLYANKIVHAGDGGFVLAKNPVFGEKLKSLANHGFTPSYHFVHFDIAMNCKINGIGAAMATACLEELPFIMKHRSQLSSQYRSMLAGTPLKLMPECGWNDTPWVFGVECSSKHERTRLRKYLAKFGGIETRDYFFPLHLQPAYNSINFDNCSRRLPNAERFGSTGFYLPTFTNLQTEDIAFICNIIQKFYETEKGKDLVMIPDNGGNDGEMLSISKLPVPLKKLPSQTIFIEPNTFEIQLNSFNPNTNSFQPHANWGTLNKQGHPIKKAIKLVIELEEAIVLESWTKQQLLLDEMQSFIEQVEYPEMKQNLIQQFQVFIDYFKSQSKYNELSVNQRPWLKEDLNDRMYEPAISIPTTSDAETIQLLVWLVKQRKLKRIWEIGAWFGHTTARLAAAAKAFSPSNDVTIYACDVFQWQKWMGKYSTKAGRVTGNDRKNGSGGGSFLSEFQEYTEVFKDLIVPVIWPYTITRLPAILDQSEAPDLVFVDITQEEEELEFIWNLILTKLKPNHTILVFNGFVAKSLPFFTRHAKSLRPIAKPKTIAKAFLYVDKDDESSKPQQVEIPSVPLDRKLKFHSSPSWTHHHQNAFGRSIELLKSALHDPNASTLFIPAIEETLCDSPELLAQNFWIGIIHSVEKHPEFFYTPDLTRLCSNEFRPALLKCKGLFTLTKFQADFLRRELGKVLKINIPIQNLTYPMIPGILTSEHSSTVVESWKQGNPIKFLLVGSFARDFDLFYNCHVPSNLIKTIVAGDETIQQEVDQRQKSNEAKSIQVLPRLNDVEYEEVLQECIMFLPLKYDGAANTTILECISRNVPILVPSLQSCIEYIGPDYPLIYEHGNTMDFKQLLTFEKVQGAVEYLRNMDKSRFEPVQLVQSVQNSSVLLAVPPEVNLQQVSLSPEKMAVVSSNVNIQYDVTISICSYKRTHHLSEILHSLWYNQDFSGRIQIIVWNNNFERSDLVHQICKEYLTMSRQESKSLDRSIEVIDSTENYYCSIRFALASIMKSSVLLICDDDILPNQSFVSFFMSAHLKYPTNVLCTRGHVFLSHHLSDLENPTDVWNKYEYLRFKNDETPEQFIHFVHADTCLIPKSALREVCSVELPDPSFHLVDDYWMSFILNFKFGRNLRKLSIAGLKDLPFARTDDSDMVGLALHTRPEVKDAKLRLYLHHKLQDWPQVESNDENLKIDEIKRSKEMKQAFWDTPFVGYNVSSQLTRSDVQKLFCLGVKCVRIGAVGMGGMGSDEYPYELDQLNDNPELQVKKLRETIEMLAESGISVVITTSKKLATPLNWRFIAKGIHVLRNVVGYDLINEPFLASELGMHRTELANVHPNGIPHEVQTYMDLIQAVRQFDTSTPIIIEPTFWGHVEALRLLPIDKFLKYDSNLIVSFHFYEPRLITQRTKNRDRFQFPGSVPIYDIKYSEAIHWDANEIKTQLATAIEWSKSHGEVKIFLGEFGICRDIQGADKYLQAILEACYELGLSSFIYSFRDNHWDAMNYELGQVASNYFLIESHEKTKTQVTAGNQLMEVIQYGIQKMNSKN